MKCGLDRVSGPSLSASALTAPPAAPVTADFGDHETVGRGD
jgi:hypothetical protein